MLRQILERRVGVSLVIVSQVLLAACNNTYGPPMNGKPANWGQQHYLDVQKYRELNENSMNR